MQERLVAKLQNKNRNRLLMFGTVLLVPGLALLIIKGLNSIPGRALTLFGSMILIWCIWLLFRKVEIVGNCGIAKQFLKTRLFYLSEIRDVDYTAGGDRIVACDSGKVKIFDTERQYGNYEEIVSVCKNPPSEYVREPEIENGKMKSRVATLTWLGMCICAVATVYMYVTFGKIHVWFLAGGIAFVILKMAVVDSFSDSEDVILEEHGNIVHEAQLISYLDDTWGTAYPLYKFKDKKGWHMVYESVKRDTKEVMENIGNTYDILYAPGKAAAVKRVENREK